MSRAFVDEPEKQGFGRQKRKGPGIIESVILVLRQGLIILG